MKKTALNLMIGTVCCAGAASVQALTITWGDNPGTAFDYSADPGTTAAFIAGIEMRAYTGGSEHLGWRSSLTGGSGAPVQWTFDDLTGQLVSVSGADATPGGVVYGPPDSAAPSGGPGLFESGTAFGAPFGFLAPLPGSAAGDAYGVATFAWTGAQSFAIHMPIMEMQWAGFASLPGLVSGDARDHGAGVDFACQLDAVPISSSVLGNVTCMAEEFLSLDEEYNFIGMTMQWQLAGTATSEVPVPAAVWLFGSGLLGMFGNLIRRSV